MIDQISNGKFTAKLVSEQPKVVFKSETDEILRITHEGNIYLHGRKIETDDEIREGLREWLASMGFSRIKAERDKLIEALRWYADEENQKLDESTRYWENVYSPYEMDGGKRARDILKEIGVMDV